MESFGPDLILSKSKGQHKFYKFMIFSVFFACSFRQLRLIPILSPTDIFLIGAFLLIILNQELRSEFIKYTKYIVMGSFFFVYFMISSFLVSKAPLESTMNYLKIFFAFLCLPLTISIFFQFFKNGKLLFEAFLLGSLSAIIFGIFSGNQQVVQDRTLGFTGHPVYNGILISLSISIVISNFQSNSFLKILHLLILPVLIYAFFQTASSTGLVIILSSMSFALIQLLRQKRFFLFVFLITLSTLLGILIWNSPEFSLTKKRLLLALNPSRGFSLINSSGVSTLDGRKLSIIEGWIKIKSNLFFGHGLDVYGTNTSINLQPHNFLVLAWLSGGIVLFLLAIIFTIVSIRFLYFASKLGATLETNVIIGSLIALMSCPLIYERSILAPLLLAIFSISHRKADLVKRAIF